MGILDRLGIDQQKLDATKEQYAALREKQREMKERGDAKRWERDAKRAEKAAEKARKVASTVLYTVDGTLSLYSDRVELGGLLAGGKGGSVPLADMESIDLIAGEEFTRRTTFTRLGAGAAVGTVLLGPVGLLAGLGAGVVAKKSRGGERFLTIESEGTVLIAQVERKRVGEATRFIAAVKRAAAEV